MNKYIPVIGLEIHVELATASKMFCGCPADWFGKKPNTQTCPVCLAMPGALPVPNKKAIEWTILIAKALGCSINKTSKFDRKNYFYPDLPKGYQISQYDEPIGINGEVIIARSNNSNDSFKVGITRVHLEEDTGKLLHRDNETLVDFNRSGVPLVEIVTEPDFDNSADVKLYLEELQTIIRYLKVSGANMEEGSMRLEPNISVGIKDTGLPNYKVEVKNINSFKFVKDAIEYEIKRQTEILEKGKTPTQETRGYDENKKITVSQRTKEEAHDYRYFPEPDIPPLVFDETFLSEIIVPELPAQKMERFVKEYSLRYQDAFILTRDKKTSEVADYILVNLGDIPKQHAANILVNEKLNYAKGEELILEDIKREYKLKNELKKSFNETELNEIITKVLGTNGKAVSEYKSGKINVLMFLVGQVMKEMKGQADPSLVKTKLEEKLK